MRTVDRVLYYLMTLFQVKVKVKVKVTLLLAVYRQSGLLGARPLETHDQRFLFQLNSCGNNPNVTSSLTRNVRLSVMNMLALSSSVYFAHIACYCKILIFALRTSPLSIQTLDW
jgi:hypothetical protein